jgi:nucleotide-binding universal stress UspA family protein
MRPIEKILVPTDFSEHAKAALEMAIELAQKHGARIVLLHAYQLPADGAPSGATVPSGHLFVHAEETANRLQRAAAAYDQSGVGITTSVLPGPPWEQILEAVKLHDASLIVMGSRGLRGLPRLLMGSTAERVARCSPVPVLITHAVSAIPEIEAVVETVEYEGPSLAERLTEQWLI